MVESFHLRGDIARAQLALATPFVQKSQEHAIRSKLVLFPQRLRLLVLVAMEALAGHLSLTPKRDSST